MIYHERAVLVYLVLDNVEESAFSNELKELALSAGVNILTFVTGKRRIPDPNLFVGTGKAGEIRQAILQYDAELVIFNHTLTPRQEHNLEKFLQCRVLDRTALILDIFAKFANSAEGKLQVELAQLQHLSTRLVKGWTHLERQRGGIGLRGPGEKQLETDRRLLAKRIHYVQTKLVHVEQRRGQNRRARNKANIPSVSLVGYTNAGKSTLFNLLTQAKTYVADRLFSTLDLTMRKIILATGNIPIILIDTVGFISNLPHELIAAFRATLRETCEARLLLHVIDASIPDCRSVISQVNTVLEVIGAAGVPQISVFNKIDLTSDTPHIERDTYGQVRSIWLSALSGHGLDLLSTALVERFHINYLYRKLVLPVTAARIRSRLFSIGAVISEENNLEGCWCINVRISQTDFDILQYSYGLRAEWII